MTKKLKVGLVGFFGWGNFGDELFVKVFEQWLGTKFELFVLNDLAHKPYFSRPITEVLAEVDAIVIGGGDLIIPWAKSELYWRDEYLDKPVFIVGVGVPTWRKANPQIIQQYKSFLTHSNVSYINVRDRESAFWINKYISPRIQVDHSVDIVFSLTMPPRDISPEKYLGIVTRDRKGASDDLAQVTLLANKAIAEGYKIKHIILGIGEVGKRDFQRSHDLDLADKVVVYSDSLSKLCSEISSCAILASMKFHGTVVAINYGIPSIVLSSTDKNRNLMRMIERKELLSSLNDDSLPDRLHPFVPVIPYSTIKLLRQRAEKTMSDLMVKMSDII